MSKLPSLSPEWVARHRGMTGAQMAECLAEFRRGYAEAVTDIRGRCKAILTSPEAKGREEMAQHLAFDTDITTQDALGALAKMPRRVEAPKGRNRLGAAIAACGGSPNVGSEFDAPGESVVAIADRIANY